MGERPEKFYGKPSEGFEKTKRLAAQLLELCQTAAPALPEDLKDACRELEQRYEESTFRVVVLGMFSRGKSTFLNALIGRRLLYKSDREATGAITLLRNSPPLYRGGPFTGRDGLSEEQAQVIRQAMDQTGAVIFLVLPESLEAVGDAFYTRMLHPEGSPSQEELRRRSWFDAFRQVLARRLERGGDRARLLAAIQKDADGCIYRRFTQEEDFCPCGCRQLTEQLRLWVNDASKTMAGDVSKVYRSLTGQFSQFTKQNIQEPFGLSSSSAYAPQPVSIERRLSTPI